MLAPADPRPARPSRRRLPWLVLAGVVVLAAVAGTLVLTHDSGPAPHATPPVVGTTAGSAYPPGPDLVPATGALFGAWVQNGSLTQPARVAAVQGLESAIGRRLDIVNTYRRFEEPFPTASDTQFAAAGRTLMLSWVINDTLEINSGKLDGQLRDWADRMRDFDHPMLVRLRWEMDRPNLNSAMHSGPDYIAAWKHVRSIFAAQGVRDVSWVWCPTADGFAGGYAQDYYPGDDQVDWTCVDAYAGTKLRPMAELLQPFFAWAVQHPKPIIIGEYGVAVSWGGPARAAWLAAAAQTFRANPLVKAVSYFDSDPEGNAPSKQYHLAGDAPALAAFAAVAKDPWFNPG